MRVAFAIQSKESLVATSIAEEHRSLICRHPPDQCVRRSHEDAFREDLKRHRSADAAKDVMQCAASHKLPLA